jgi:hypothetical protein
MTWRRSLGAGRAHTVLTLKSGYYLDGEKATLMPVVDDISILAYEVIKGD